MYKHQTPVKTLATFHKDQLVLIDEASKVEEMLLYFVILFKSIGLIIKELNSK